jgi:1-acyl-sn-glycerol-3-phosphate acyltransferase
MNIKIKKKLGRRKGLRYSFAQIVLKIIGWKVDPVIPDCKKYILIAVPHTSNWDLPLMLIISMVIGVKLHWVSKDTLFKGVFGSYLRWLGGIPVNRRLRTNFSEQVIEVFNKAKELIIVIAPEGTRSRAEHWKTGFYHIACGAKIPISFGFLDYGKKIGGIGPLFYPNGNIEQDFEVIRKFYKNMIGKIPENSGPIKIKDKKLPNPSN